MFAALVNLCDDDVGPHVLGCRVWGGESVFVPVPRRLVVLYYENICQCFQQSAHSFVSWLIYCAPLDAEHNDSANKFLGLLKPHKPHKPHKRKKKKKKKNLDLKFLTHITSYLKRTAKNEVEWTEKAKFLPVGKACKAMLYLYLSLFFYQRNIKSKQAKLFWGPRLLLVKFRMRPYDSLACRVKFTVAG